MRHALLLALALSAAGCAADHPMAPPAGGRFNVGLLEVSEANVLMTKSMPPQVFLDLVGGGVPCTRVGPVTQTRQGNVITLRVETYWTDPVCILPLVQVRHTERLAGEFPPGDYVVVANGFEVRFKV